ncbi:ornithine decarboxylase antizyme 1-like [Clavelina lepadiformis]|uniref:Ornithine decarboxylase antizyme n=1 Tax=Clavelina lepadiformis TaxID=159417 RepID=A0ABP0GNQ6_CLALP
MKKKRKKKATSLCSLPPYQLIHSVKATFASATSLGSAPDAPNGYESKINLQRCLLFAVQLFGEEGWHDVPNEICLKTFSRQLTQNMLIQWDTVHVNDRLYVHVPSYINRDSFVALLDYAEEELGLSTVIVCFNRGSQGFRELAKSFRFMGFDHVLPDHPSVSFTNGTEEATSVPKGFHFMVYDLD